MGSKSAARITLAFYSPLSKHQIPHITLYIKCNITQACLASHKWADLCEIFGSNVNNSINRYVCQKQSQWFNVKFSSTTLKKHNKKLVSQRCGDVERCCFNCCGLSAALSYDKLSFPRFVFVFFFNFSPSFFFNYLFSLKYNFQND